MNQLHDLTVSTFLAGEYKMKQKNCQMPVGFTYRDSSAPFGLYPDCAGIKYAVFGSSLLFPAVEIQGEAPRVQVRSVGVAGTAGFSARSGHTVAVFNDGIQDAGTAFDDGTRDALWVIGGWNGSDDLNDVWKKRSDHSTAVFDDKSGSGEALWVIGGWSNYLDTYHNDVWNSTNGKNWTEVTADAALRCLMKAPVTCGSSVAGKKTAHASGRKNWTETHVHSTVVFDDKSAPVMRCGSSVAGAAAMGWVAVTLKDVWKSTDGKNWTEVTADGPVFTGRSGHSVTVFNDGSGDALWVIGGDDDSNLFDGRNDVWKSKDGITWAKVKENNNTGFSARQYHTATVFKDGSGDALWVIGGKV
ncbi:hypothetical protein CHS0354_035269 [Potamilus streckersoni]|uniref:Uncharacterized protein n=1 Tax=Potamilus streckersoni TaxID=2493646 RepID=A0AAE0VMY5_9BIVA|nr:hypothetical protein CHS0354_035269 [Potamilus streckersoni]